MVLFCIYFQSSSSAPSVHRSILPPFKRQKSSKEINSGKLFYIMIRDAFSLCDANIDLFADMRWKESMKKKEINENKRIRRERDHVNKAKGFPKHTYCGSMLTLRVFLFVYCVTKKHQHSKAELIGWSRRSYSGLLLSAADRRRVWLWFPFS